MKIVIDGMGRIGRLLVRHLVSCPGVDIVGVCEATTSKVLAHLIRHDTVHGRAPFSVDFHEKGLLLGGWFVPLHQDIRDLTGVDLVIDCRKRLSQRSDAEGYFRQGAKQVLVAAPCDGADLILVPGVNDDRLKDMRQPALVSAASPTTHCLAWMLQAIEDAFGLEYALMTAVHSYTNDQQLLDLPHDDLRRARAAATSMVPTESRALACIGQVMPQFAGRVEGLAVRVPSPDMSLLDLTVLLPREVTVSQVNDTFDRAAALDERGLLRVLQEELVSCDLVGESASCLFDPFLTRVMQGRMVKVFGWYDNEWAFSARLKDMTLMLDSSASGRSSK